MALSTPCNSCTETANIAAIRDAIIGTTKERGFLARLEKLEEIAITHSELLTGGKTQGLLERMQKSEERMLILARGVYVPTKWLAIIIAVLLATAFGKGLTPDIINKVISVIPSVTP